jgi:predicted transcriptional regulator
MSTTIQVSDRVKKELEALKEYRRETYNDVIEKLVSVFRAVSEDYELKEEVLEEMKEAREEIKAGKGLTTKQLLKELGVSAE